MVNPGQLFCCCGLALHHCCKCNNIDCNMWSVESRSPCWVHRRRGLILAGIWTLLVGALVGTEGFTPRKLIGVFATLAGVILTSTVDLSGDNEKNRGYFPHKSRKELAIGDMLALASAVMYGVYTTVLKKKVGNEARVNMTLFFGFVGLFNLILLFPGLVIFHFSGLEKFQFPPTKRIWAIVMVSCTHTSLRWWRLINSVLDQFDHFPRLRCMLGLFDAAHNSDCRHSRT